MSMSDYLQAAVDKLEPPAGISYNVALFHYLRGSNKNPYELRRTNVVLSSNTRLFELGGGILKEQESKGTVDEKKTDPRSPEKILKEQESELHRQSMQEYIKYLDRDNTFLSLIVKKFNSLLSNDSSFNNFLGELSIISSPKHVVEEVEVDANSPFSVKWEIDIRSANTLSFVATNQENTNQSKFFEDIYRNRKINEEWSQAFKYARADVFGKISNDEMSFNQKTEKWDLISSIQGILLFLSAVNYSNASDCHDSTSNLSCSFSIVKSNSSNIDTEIELAVTIISPSLDSNNIRKLIQDRCEENTVNMFTEIKDGSEPGTPFSELSNLLQLPKIEDECLKFIKDSIYHSSRKQTNIDEAQWAILLTHYLANKKHEGKLLDFFIICGELSQFNDLHQIKFRTLSNINKQALQWPNSKFDELIEAQKVAKQIANEHYPWFDSGRYALFWNTASAKNDNAPVGLISIENFSWINIVESRFRDGLPFALPNCLICHVYGYPQKIGVQIVENHRVKELLRYQDNKWKSIINESRKEDLQSLLEGLLNPINKIDKMIDIIIHISEHPEKGGTIVFVENNETLKEFGNYKKDMGSPWKLEEITSEDVISLVSQDGATLCPVKIKDLDNLDLQSLQYRKLLLSTDLAIELLSAIEKQWDDIRIDNADWPLAAKGSRRWNSAIAACNHLVNTVLVISQDGDIQVWHIDNNFTAKANRSKKAANGLDGITRLEIHEFPLKGKHKRLGFYQKDKKIKRTS